MGGDTQGDIANKWEQEQIIMMMIMMMMIENRVHCTFISICFVLVFFFCLRSCQIQIIFKQIYLTHTGTTILVPGGPGSNGNKGFSTLLNLQNLEPHHQTQFSLIPRIWILFRGWVISFQWRLSENYKPRLQDAKRYSLLMH